MTPESENKFDDQAADIVALLIVVALVVAGLACLALYLWLR